MTIYTKVCTSCKQSKVITDFHKNKSTKDGLNYSCKLCVKEYYELSKKQTEEDKQKIKEEKIKEKEEKKILPTSKVCKKCKTEKIIDLFGGSGYNSVCKECINAAAREYERKRREANVKPSKRYKAAKKIRNREGRRKRYAEDPLFALSSRIRNIVSKAFRKMGYSKTSKTNEILGCSFEELKLHIESQFIEGMSWENRSRWHIDHKVPISWGKTEEEIIALNHYSNLKPMWALDNILKNNKYSD